MIYLRKALLLDDVAIQKVRPLYAISFVLAAVIVLLQLQHEPLIGLEGNAGASLAP